MFQKPPTDHQLQAAIDRIYSELNNFDPDSDEYAKHVSQLSKLYALKENPSDKRVSPDTWVTAGAYLLGIIVIVGYERTHVVTSKAMAFIKKP